LSDPAGRDRLLQTGAQAVPVLAKGDRYIFCQNLEDVAEFVGLESTGHTPLPPSELIAKWLTILRTAEDYIRRLPAQALPERVIPERDRSIRLLGHHIFRIGEAFLETVVSGVEYSLQLANIAPPAHTFTTAEAIAGYGESIIDRLANWWTKLEDKSCAQKVKTFYGTPPMHQLLERSTWHSAQHTRQLLAVLQRFGIEPDRRLTAEDLAGLPLPEGLWE
jgi:hypothetical protein